MTGQFSRSVYVLEVTWSWDDSNTELVTINEEACEAEASKTLPERILAGDRLAYDTLRNLANHMGGVLRSPDLVALYVLGGRKYVPLEKSPNGKMATLREINLDLVVRFDKDGRPSAP